MRKEILKNQFPATSLEKKHLQRRLGSECVKNLKKSRLQVDKSTAVEKHIHNLYR